jgi:mannosylglycerate hydrolase
MSRIIVVPHTHWDREWYLPFERYRYFMVRMIDELLQILDEEDGFTHFLLDGQVVLLEDYLEIRPEKEEALIEGITNGRIGTGPWYTMPDEFLVSGEALIRNLMLGHRLGEAYGGVMKVGYLPDPFGHISQMPQILRGFGIDTACMMRGVDWPQAEFYWEAPDGSRVLTHWFSLGYANAFHLTENPETFRYMGYEGLQSMLDALSEVATTDVLLLMNGNDHLEPQPEVTRIIHELNARTEHQILQGSLVDFFTLVKEQNPRLLTYHGEMRSAKHQPILPGVLSSRIYLKQRNFHVQNLLEGYAEPIASFASVLGEEYPTGFLREAWKLVIQNHFHDSICASSVDQVHQEMMTRFDKSEQIIESLLADFLPRLANRLIQGGEEVGLFVFNPTSRQRNGKVEAWISVKSIRSSPSGEIILEERLPSENFSLLSPEGKVTPYQILERKFSPGNILLGETFVERWKITFVAHEILPFGWCLYRLVPIQEGAYQDGMTLVEGNALENEFYRVTIQEDGGINIMDKEAGAVYTDLAFYEDSADSGDEYNYNPPLNQEIFVTRGGQAEISVLQDEPDWGTIRIKHSLELPRCLSEGRRGRSEERVLCEITTDVTLIRGVRRIDFRTTLDNQASDHRLRVVFPSGIPTAESIAQSAFAYERRPVELPDGGDWVEMPSPTHPTGGAVVVEGEGRGLAVFGKGLPEYEVTAQGEICLTLLRSVGWLSRPDLETRPSNAGPPYPTPEAQCLGEHVYEFALMPFKGEWLEGGNCQESLRFNRPPIAALIPIAADAAECTGQFLAVEPQELMVSAVMRSEDGEAIILRFYNASTKPVDGKLNLSFNVSKAFEVNLQEEDGEPLDMDGAVIHFYARGAEIKTIKIFL